MGSLDELIQRHYGKEHGGLQDPFLFRLSAHPELKQEPLKNKLGDGIMGALPGGLTDVSGLTEYALPSYDVGTDYVPETGPAIVHKGERIIPADQNPGGALINELQGRLAAHADAYNKTKAPALGALINNVLKGGKLGPEHSDDLYKIAQAHSNGMANYVKGMLSRELPQGPLDAGEPPVSIVANPSRQTADAGVLNNTPPPVTDYQIQPNIDANGNVVSLLSRGGTRYGDTGYGVLEGKVQGTPNDTAINGLLTQNAPTQTDEKGPGIEAFEGRQHFMVRPTGAIDYLPGSEVPGNILEQQLANAETMKGQGILLKGKADEERFGPGGTESVHNEALAKHYDALDKHYQGMEKILNDKNKTEKQKLKALEDYREKWLKQNQEKIDKSGTKGKADPMADLLGSDLVDKTDPQVQKALKAGYSEAEIADYLKKKKK